ncbi:MAG: TonB-dependent receptor, partial [Bacteroidota bacterium]
MTARWYHNHEYAKNTWSGSYLAASIQNQLLDNTSWKQRFVDAYAGEITDLPSANIAAARTYADRGMASVGSPEWLAARRASVASPTVFNPEGVIGAKLAENSAFWQADLVYDFNNQLPKDGWKILVGANFRRYTVDSDGAFFNDNRLVPNSLVGAHIGYKDNIHLAESGLFGQVGNKFFEDRLQLSFVGRFNHHTNFKLNFTPQIAAVFTPDVSRKHHFRTSFTTGVRNPGIQEQYINFLISPNHVILGGTMDNLDNYYDPFLDLTGTELQAVLKEQLGYDHQGLRPERNSTLEVGYKTLLVKGKLLMDVNAYGSQYLNFVERANLTITGGDGQPKIHALYANLSDKVTAYGVGANVEYVFQKYYKLYAMTKTGACI